MGSALASSPSTRSFYPYGEPKSGTAANSGRRCSQRSYLMSATRTTPLRSRFTPAAIQSDPPPAKHHPLAEKTRQPFHSVRDKLDR